MPVALTHSHCLRLKRKSSLYQYEMKLSILVPCMQSTRAVRPDFGPGVNLFIYGSAWNSAAAESTLIKFGCKREES